MGIEPEKLASKTVYHIISAGRCLKIFCFSNAKFMSFLPAQSLPHFSSLRTLYVKRNCQIHFILKVLGVDFWAPHKVFLEPCVYDIRIL
jgi:hypothetical protein